MSVLSDDGLDDALLLEAIRRGDRDALERLLARYEGRVYRFGLQVCRDREDARDVLQETLVAVARGVGSFRGESSLATWLYTIARRFCVKHRRRAERARRLAGGGEGASEPALGDGRSASAEDAVPHPTALEELREPGLDPGAALERREAEEQLHRALHELDRGQREVLVLRDVEGLSAAETAAVLGVGVAAVKSRLHRARRALRERLVGRIAEPEAAVPSAGGAPCPDVLTLYSERLEGELSPTLCAELAEHVSRCPRCTAACDSLKQVLARCSAAPLPAVPPEVQRAVRAALNA